MANFPGASAFFQRPYKLFLKTLPTYSIVPGLKIKSASIQFQAAIANHPIEDGSVMTEHKVIQPRQLRVDGICVDDQAYETLVAVYNVTNNVFCIRVKELLLTSCTMSDLTALRDSKMLSAIPVQFTLTEVLKVVVTQGKQKTDVANPADATTSKTGQVTGATPDPQQQRTFTAQGIGANR